jgi:hypothetical protein
MIDSRTSAILLRDIRKPYVMHDADPTKVSFAFSAGLEGAIQSVFLYKVRLRHTTYPLRLPTRLPFSTSSHPNPSL